MEFYYLVGYIAGISMFKWQIELNNAYLWWDTSKDHWFFDDYFKI